MGALEFSSIEKIYANGVKAVSGFDLQVADGEFVVLVGPSGCGKSTVLRMIAGLEGISSGDLYLDGRLINKLAPVDRDVSIVFQDYALYGHMTVFDNIGMGLKVRHTPSDALFSTVMETSDFLKIRSFLNRYPDQLSGGQKQRVSLGRAIARKPKVFLMDEPLSNLDAKLRTHTQAELVRIQRELGVTTIYVTHDQHEAMTMADRIVVMEGGVIQQVGTPMEVYEHPRNLFVATFIGMPVMNILHGTIEGNRFIHRGRHFTLPHILQDMLAPWQGKAVAMGVRPEHILLGSTKDDEATFTLTVQEHEFLGSQYLLYLNFDGMLLTAKVDRSAYRTQATVRVSFDMGRIHFFDGKTTERICMDSEVRS